MSASTKPGYFHISTNLTDITKKIDPLDPDKDKKNFGKETAIDANIHHHSTDEISITYKYNTDAITGAGYIDYIIAAAQCRLKGNVDYQMIPISPSTIKTLYLYIDGERKSQNINPKHTDTLFINRRGSCLSRQMIFLIIKDLAEKGLYFLGDNFNAKPPRHLITFVDFVKEFIGYASNRSSGACGLPNLIPYMYYFWKKDVEDGYYVRNPDS